VKGVWLYSEWKAIERFGGEMCHDLTLDFNMTILASVFRIDLEGQRQKEVDHLGGCSTDLGEC